MWLQSLQSSFNVLITSVICHFFTCKVPGMIVGKVKIISMLVTLQLCNCKVGLFLLKIVDRFWVILLNK